MFPKIAEIYLAGGPETFLCNIKDKFV